MGTDVLQRESGELGPPFVCPAQEGHSKEVFLPRLMCLHVHRRATLAEPPLPTHHHLLHLLLLHSIIHQDRCGLSSRSIQSHSRPIAGAPFRSSFQVPAHRWMRSYPHCPKPQLRYDSKVTNKRGGHRLNFPSVGEPLREISNCESRG